MTCLFEEPFELDDLQNCRATILTEGMSHFTELLDDNLVRVMSFLELHDILSLRRTCKKLNRATRLRVVWVDLVRRDIVDGGLPWPSYARTTGSLPVEAIEDLALRSIRFSRRWISEDLRPIEARHIRQPSGSISWITTHLSRWIIAASTDCNILIWDLFCLKQVPLARWTGLDSFVESGFLNPGSENTMMVDLIVNTNMSTTYLLSITFPSYHEATAPVIYQKESFPGYSNILAVQGELLAFGRRPDDNLPHIRNISTGRCARLQKHRDSKRLQFTVAVQLRPTVVVVAKTSAIELYSPSVLKDLENGADFTSDSTFDAYPMQQFVYPARNVLGVRILDYPSPLLASNKEAPIIISVRFTRELVHLELRYRDLATDDSLGYVYAMTEKPVMVLHTNPTAYTGHETLTMCISSGSQGARYIWAYTSHDKGRSELEVLGGCPKSSSRLLWTPPLRHLPDLPRLSVFDDCTGLVLLVMASGTIWILDYGSRRLTSSAEDTTLESEKNNRIDYFWGGWKCSDQSASAIESAFPDSQCDNPNIVDDWVLVSRRIEPEDPLPPPPGYAPWSLDATNVRGIASNTLSGNVTSRTNSPLLHLSFLGSQQYGYIKWAFNQILHIPERHYLRFKDGYPAQWLGYDASKFGLKEVIERTAECCGMWGGYGSIDPDKWGEILAWDARQTFIQQTLGGEWELTPMSMIPDVLM